MKTRNELYRKYVKPYCADVTYDDFRSSMALLHEKAVARGEKRNFDTWLNDFVPQWGATMEQEKQYNVGGGLSNLLGNVGNVATNLGQTASNVSTALGGTPPANDETTTPPPAEEKKTFLGMPVWMAWTAGGVILAAAITGIVIAVSKSDNK